MQEARVYQFPRVQEMLDSERLKTEQRRQAEERMMHRHRMRVHARWALAGIAACVVVAVALELSGPPSLKDFLWSFLFGCAATVTLFRAYKYDWHARRYYD